MKKAFIFLISLFPFVSYGADERNFSQIVTYIIGLIYLAIPVLISGALLAFFWGLTKFITKSGDEKNHQEGKDLMVWGIIALFIMITYMGIVKFLSAGFGFDGTAVFPLLKTS